MSTAYCRLDNLHDDAAKRGVNVVEPGPHDIFVDLDSQQDQYVMEALLRLFEANGYPITLEKITRSQHGNKHAYLKAPQPLTDTQRVLLQAVLGSDRKREAISFLRIINDVNPPSAFFEVNE